MYQQRHAKALEQQRDRAGAAEGGASQCH
jgi:hypothetical protein